MSCVAPRSNLAANRNSTYVNQGQAMATYVNDSPRGVFLVPGLVPFAPLLFKHVKSNRNQTEIKPIRPKSNQK